MLIKDYKPFNKTRTNVSILILVNEWMSEWAERPGLTVKCQLMEKEWLI